MNLGKNQQKVIDILQHGNPMSIDDISNQTEIKSQTVRNILNEFIDAGFVSISKDNLYSIRNKRASISHNSYDNDAWKDFKPVLKNLARIA